MKNLYLTAIGCLLSFAVNAQNLVFHTKFNNGQAQDISANAHHGVLSGGPTACPGLDGIPNTALFFDGVNDRVQLPTHTDFNLTQWTLHAVVKPASFSAALCESDAIIWHGGQWSNDFYGMHISDNYYDGGCGPNTDMEAFGGQATGSSSSPDFQSPWYTANGYVDTNQWYCVVLTYDGSAMKLYINGDIVDSGIWISQYNITGPSTTYIGYSSEPNYPYWFNGAIDEISIWDDAVTLSQVNNNLCDSFLTSSVNNIQNQEAQIEVYPSPATDAINLEIGNKWNGSAWEIMNSVGQLVIHGNAENGKNKIDINELASGVYIMKVSKGAQMKLVKFIKN